MEKNKSQTLGRLTVLSSFLAVFILFGYRSSFSVLQVPMGEELGWSTAALSTGYSLMMVIYAITAYFSGMLIDRYGTRPCYAIGAVFSALGFLLTSMLSAENYPLYFLTYSLCAGIGTGMLWVTSTVSVRKWYVGKAYGTMWGIAFAGAPLAQVLISLGLKSTLKSMDWHASMLGLAAVSFVALVIAAAVATRTPEHYGLQPNGNLKAVGAAPKEEKVWNVKEAFKTFPIWGTIICFLCCVVGEFLVWTQIVNYYVSDLGMDLSKATYLYVLIGICGIFTMPIMGIVSDKLVTRLGNEVKGRKIMLIAAPVLGIVACILLILAKQSIIFGIIASVLFAAYWAIEPGGCTGYAGSVYGQKSIGKIWGLATLIIMGIGPALGSFVGAVLKDVFGSYTYSFLFGLSAFVISAVCACVLPQQAAWKK